MDRVWERGGYWQGGVDPSASTPLCFSLPFFIAPTASTGFCTVFLPVAWTLRLQCCEVLHFVFYQWYGACMGTACLQFTDAH